MNKRIFILNGVGTSGKGEFASRLDKRIPLIKYSIIDLIKETAENLGWNGGKTEKDRKFLSDLMDLATEYNDSPYKDVAGLVDAFKTELPEEILIIDMRDPKDIERAVKDFGAETILMRNPRIGKIKSNHADANVEQYKYDYIIENNGSLEQLDSTIDVFIQTVIEKECALPESTYCIHHTDSGKNTIVFECNKMLG